ncbi:SHOCT domain-containing protein [Hoyosella rhizosphaerae]|uniref:SHOCT domain-containing protein n=1 Tax=Hoyosella rhizosphaerae TaxID=1755582 RepID=A0A916U201_9ACTN|nr:SHOCT domain-containing protein [Hoyosella rhizosphaerae]MBN4926789.1 SHOCT domain-containing protein [Hoyosella rhizosphaerae]GGC56435.1 hypothetical protein GCM10011410_06150 [Hoyosella rhizosphaerae]
MMYGFDGTGWVWMALMPVVWIGLIVLIVWAVVRLTQDRPGRDRGVDYRESPEDILDRRFARGEIDADEYGEARKRLAEHRRGSA